MKRVRFRDPAGAVRHGEWRDGQVHFADRSYDPTAVDLLAPCEPSKIVCVGRNYVEHADELDNEVPDRPLLFLKGPNAVAAHGDTIELPGGDRRIEHEAELGVVIGRQCRGLARENAMEAVAGYTCVNDISNRTDQRAETNWIRGKAFDGAAPMGPVVAPPEGVPPDASITCDVNGERRQSGRLDLMVFDVPTLLAEITELLTLEPGDVVATGTPAGVGPLTDGDTVAIEIEGVGRLEHGVSTP